MRVAWLIVHRIVDVHALMIEQLSEWNHCRILKIFAEAPRH